MFYIYLVFIGSILTHFLLPNDDTEIDIWIPPLIQFWTNDEEIVFPRIFKKGVPTM